MIIFEELSKALPQAVFARIVGRSEARVSQWVNDGTLPAGGTGLQWLHAVIDRLSEEAAGRASDGPLDLAQERAALARAQRQLIEEKLSVQRGEYKPIQWLTEVLATASQAIAERLEHLPGQLRRSHPQLSAAVLDSISARIAEARNEWVRQTSELVAEKIISIDDENDPDEAAAQAEADGP